MDYHMLYAVLFISAVIVLVLLFPALLGKGWRVTWFGLGDAGSDSDGGGDGGGGD